MELKFYICKHCGNIVRYIVDKGVKVKCCGETMEELIPNTVDAAKEKHVPVYTVKDNIVTVNVGDVDHPMIPEHFIQFVILQTKNGVQRKDLKPGEKPNVQFAITADDEVVAVFAYCNLHGLWKA